MSGSLYDVVAGVLCIAVGYAQYFLYSATDQHTASMYAPTQNAPQPLNSAWLFERLFTHWVLIERGGIHSPTHPNSALPPGGARVSGRASVLLGVQGSALATSPAVAPAKGSPTS